MKNTSEKNRTAAEECWHTQGKPGSELGFEEDWVCVSWGSKRHGKADMVQLLYFMDKEFESSSLSYLPTELVGGGQDSSPTSGL